jgi:drug/metabolite transporter (DMT)-like permease
MTREAVLGAQAAYFLATGAAPFLSRRLFEAVTGPKREWWLVQTLGGVVCVLGAGFAAAAARGRTTPELTGIAVGSAGVLAAADVLFVARRRIAPTYLLDAAAEVALVAAHVRAGRGAEQHAGEGSGE